MPPAILIAVVVAALWRGRTRLRGPLTRLVLIASSAMLAGALLTAAIAPSGYDGAVSIGLLGLLPLAVLASSTSGPRSSTALWAGACCGAVLAMAIAVVQVSMLGWDRAEGLTGNAIVFGDVAVVLGALAVALYPVVGARGGASLGTSLVALGSGAMAAVLSGSRGAWVAVPVVCALLVWHHRRSLLIRYVGPAALVFASVVGAGLVLSDGMPAERARAAITDVRDYIGADEHYDPARGTTIGARFEAWRSAVRGFASSPLLGIGWGNMDDLFEQHVAHRMRHPRLVTFDHAHNQFLGALANGGLVGLSSLVVALAVPGVVFVRRWWDRAGPSAAVGLAGVVLVTCYALFAQTEAVFEGVVPVVFFGLVVGGLATALDHTPDTGSDVPSRVAADATSDG